MSNLRQAAQQALEALEYLRVTVSTRTEANVIGGVDLFPKEIAALRAALAEPQTTHWDGCESVHPECRKPEPVVQLEFAGTLPISRGGYAPTPRKPVELTDEEIVEVVLASDGMSDFVFARALIATYKAKQGEQK